MKTLVLRTSLNYTHRTFTEQEYVCSPTSAGSQHPDAVDAQGKGRQNFLHLPLQR